MSSILAATETFSTDAPPAAVWAALAKPQRWPEVLTDLREGSIDPPGRLTEGATIRTFARPDTKAVDMVYRVVTVEPERRLAFRSEGKDWRGETDYAIEGADTTRVTLTVSIEPLGFWPRLAVRLWRSVYQDQLATNLRVRTRCMLQLAEIIARESAKM
jgi:uncharacterized protein YndB with AHSA1/START domain